MILLPLHQPAAVLYPQEAPRVHGMPVVVQVEEPAFDGLGAPTVRVILPGWASVAVPLSPTALRHAADPDKVVAVAILAAVDVLAEAFDGLILGVLE